MLETPTQVFSGGYCEIFKNTYFDSSNLIQFPAYNEKSQITQHDFEKCISQKAGLQEKLFLTYICVILVADLCNPNPCENNAICLQDGDENYKCICPYGYKGSNCQSK